MPEVSDQEFDKSEDGKATIALLERHAPPKPDFDLARDTILAQLPAGRKISLRYWLTSVVSAAAIVLVSVFMFQDPPETPDSPSGPAPSVVGLTEITVEDIPDTEAKPELGLEVHAIKPVSDGWLLNRGLTQGLRVGDTLETAGINLQVTAAGVFQSRGRVLEGKPSRGESLRSSSLTATMKHARNTRDFGGDAGGFYVFGASFDLLSIEQAKDLGIEHGTALQVREIFSSIYQPNHGESIVTPAAKLGLQAGDVLLKIDGQPVPDFVTFGKVLGWQIEKNWLTARVLRNGAPLDLRLNFIK